MPIARGSLRVNARGWVFLALALSVGVAAAVKGNNLLFAVFSALFGILAVCGLMTVLLARKVEVSMGFDFASVLTPSYFAKQMTDEILEGYYRRIADESPLPLLLYHAPQHAGGVTFSSRCLSRLAEHPNIAGMKDSSAA